MSEAPDLIRLTSPDGGLSAWIAPDQGAELCGLEWKGRELLWRGRDFSPNLGWTGRAPILWPAIGRTFAPGPEPTAETFKQAPLGWTVDGVDHPMLMHGFARSLPWSIETHADATLRLRLIDSDRTRSFYPFGFQHTVDYAVADDVLTLHHRINADPANSGPMPFALGNHATFDLTQERAVSDWWLSTNATRRMALDPAGRPDGRTVALAAFARPAPVTDLATFDVVALSAGEAPWARLTSLSGLAITVHHAVQQPEWSSLEFVTLWGDPEGGYLSLEAWLGKPNALATGDGACRLPPGAALDWTLTIAVEDLSARRPSPG